jgi:uncharacterized integral membrane protein
MKHIKAIVSILIMLLVIILIVENLEQLSKSLTLMVDLLFWSYKTPPMQVYLLLIIVFLLGVFVAGFLGIFERFRLKKEIRSLSREKTERTTQLDSLMSTPAVGGAKEDKEPEGEDQAIS